MNATYHLSLIKKNEVRNLLFSVACVLTPVYEWTYKVTGTIHFVWVWNNMSAFHPFWWASLLSLFALTLVIYENTINEFLSVLIRVAITCVAAYLIWSQFHVIKEMTNLTLLIINGNNIFANMVPHYGGLHEQWLSPSDKGLQGLSSWMTEHPNDRIVLTYNPVSPYIYIFTIMPFAFETYHKLKRQFNAMQGGQPRNG